MRTREAEVLAKEYGELTQTKEAEASAPPEAEALPPPVWAGALMPTPETDKP